MNFTRPSQLPTPPETDTDFLASGLHSMDFMNAPSIHVGHGELDMNPHPSVGAGAPFRRVSTLAYHSSPLRDPRERSNVRQSRWLIVVIPPTSLVQDHGPLGHTLTSGPSQRLSQGTLMPLQPTMYGQLNAIVREFNFPSPVGICLYLHVAEHGFNLTPRISDEIWPALWGHLFEARSPAPAFHTPICGRIEFDIDRRKARWLDSWLNSDRRHAPDVPVSVPTSLSHWREDSKTSFDERGDERPEVPSGLPTVAQSRHVPKKLSLVDKIESFSLTSSVANALAGSAGVRTLPNTLTTVPQEDEPRTAKITLEKRVESWRASSSIAPSPIMERAGGQISLDPVHIPSDMHLSDIDILADTDDVDDINLNDFAWSASSVGPPDYESLPSAISISHTSSVHLDRRLEGSVLLTPSTATSWGPKTFDYSPMSTLFRLPSPDIGQRVVEDCPPTPSTATSWGPEELLYSPASIEFRLTSPDLGQRMLEDSPPTPITTSSWGLRHPPVFPYLSDPILQAWTFVWPFYELENASKALPLQFPDQNLAIETCSSWGLRHPPVFPYLPDPIRQAWTFVWPFYELENASKALPLQFPDQNLAIETCDATCLHFRIFPVQAEESADLAFATYPMVYPYLSTYLPPPVDLDMRQEVEPFSVHNSYSHPKLSTQYPYFDLYPAGYPTNLMNIYPPAVHPRAATLLAVRIPRFYPAIELYPSQYPFIVPYPPRAVPPLSEVLLDETSGSDASDKRLSLNSGLNGLVMPTTKHSTDRQVQSVKMSGHAPLYPSLHIYPPVAKHLEAKRINIYLPQVYPRVTPYPAVYPKFDLYPPVVAEERNPKPKTMLAPEYPHIHTYSAVYPWFEIYPGHVSAGENAVATSRPVSLPQPLYPHFDLYPAVYPYFDIYRTGFPKQEDPRVPISVTLPVRYPALSLYPPTYPYVKIYLIVPQAHGNSAPREYPAPVTERTPGSTHGPTSEAGTLTRVPLRGAVQKTHKELHEEVLGAGAPEDLVEQAKDKPLERSQVRGRTHSETIPPVPPLPRLRGLSVLMPSHNAEERRGVSSGSTLEAPSPSTDRRPSSLVTHSSPIHHGESIARSNSLTSANSSPRKDPGHSRQGHRIRDSLVLEKARFFDHLNAAK
ncbi:hypothetical protein BC827DRAFT_1374293 [Russula dissimulans]|nr:hypothetical protein BC827DRAFT_1374293 [Russula dissimulans]